ncbi:hypothetical protein NPIL_663731 [Nephila pilipes]|uniref:Uncharacterized protein n=1 Tax=Nephila pilipes TaxID=299642 RepID=A0A8X6UIU2_NEPPI|nr:hypothetical protein NPIL_663731 [Nephila pilipes]
MPALPAAFARREQRLHIVLSLQPSLPSTKAADAITSPPRYCRRCTPPRRFCRQRYAPAPIFRAMPAVVRPLRLTITAV